MKFERVEHIRRIISEEGLRGKAYIGRNETIYIITGVEDSIGLKAEEIESLATHQPKPVILPNDAFIAEEDLSKVKLRFPKTYAKILEQIGK